MLVLLVVTSTKLVLVSIAASMTRLLVVVVSLVGILWQACMVRVVPMLVVPIHAVPVLAIAVAVIIPIAGAICCSNHIKCEH